MIKIVLKDSEGGEAQFPVTGELIIGRSEECAIILQDSKVSRHHARVLLDGPLAMIEDLGSSNGTFVNNQQVVGSLIIKAGDSISIGSAHMRVIQTSPLDTFGGATTVGKIRVPAGSREPGKQLPPKPIPEREHSKTKSKSKTRTTFLILGILAGIAGGLYYLFVLNQ